jgi:hypothetical protein
VCEVFQQIVDVLSLARVILALSSQRSELLMSLDEKAFQAANFALSRKKDVTQTR